MDQRTMKENLSDHLEAKRRETVSGMMWGGLLAVGGYIAAGGILKFFLTFHMERADGILLEYFWFFFLALFVVLMGIGYYYEPKERYDFGMMDNPFTRKDDHERADAVGGFFLIVPNFFYNYVKTLLSFFINDRERFDLNMAVRLLDRATQPHYTIPLKDAYASSIPKKTVDGTLITLEDGGVISISRQRGLISLTLKGRELLGKDPMSRHEGAFMP